MSKPFLKISIIFLVCSFVLTGCTLNFVKKVPTGNQSQNQNINANQNIISTGQTQTITEQLAAQTKIKKFNNYDELKSFLEENNGSGQTGSVSFGMDGVATDMVKSMPMTARTLNAGVAEGTTGLSAPSSGVEPVPATNETAQAANQSASTDFSKTNIQVAGVDEADIIKTDGKYIYAVARNNLFIVDAYPADQANILAKIEFKARPDDVYINGNYLVVYGDDQQIYNQPLYKTFRRQNSYTFLKVFDISDHKNPKQVRDLDMEGNYSDSRMIGDYLYFVTNTYNYYYLPVEPMLPRLIDGGTVLPNDCTGGAKCFAPDVYYFDMPYDNYNFTTITAVNVKDASIPVNGQVYLMPGNQNMYVSPSNIYITYTKYISEYDLMMEVLQEMVVPRLSTDDQDKISKIEAVDDFILNKSEKLVKIGVYIDRYRSSLSDDDQQKLAEELKAKMKQKYQDISKELEKTVIHKIAIDNGKLEYKTEGEVTGVVLNQFSMDENNGYFRIATTKDRTWSEFADPSDQQSYNNLYVLDDNLQVVGSLEKIATGENIQAARFMQNRAYLVTYQQTDPLFVIDLSDPHNPKILGQLKMPGFSNYLHPYDDTTLIGIGKQASETANGWSITGGLKISLYDVADVANPKEIATYTMGDRGSDSIALYDHKAFLFSKEKNLLVIPVSINQSIQPGEWGSLVFSGAAVFSIDKTSIKLRGKIDHSDGGKVAPQDFWDNYSYYDNTVKRSLYIDDTLYTMSNYYLKMNKLDTLDLVKNLPLEKEASGGGSDYRVVN